MVSKPIFQHGGKGLRYPVAKRRTTASRTFEVNRQNIEQTIQIVQKEASDNPIEVIAA